MVVKPGSINYSADFTVESSYEIAKKIFGGELSIGSSFVYRKVKVRPSSKLYTNPSFTAKSLMTANKILRILSQIPTSFP